MLDEEHGMLTVEVQTGTGYKVGDPSSASVNIRDDDKPATPANLQAHGHVTSQGITLRFDAVDGNPKYNVRYAGVNCLGGNHVCVYSSAWQPANNVSFTGTSTIEAKLPGLTAQHIYQVAVQAEIVETSPWSPTVLVYVTRAVHDAYPTIQAFDTYSYQDNGHFQYVLCNTNEARLPDGVDIARVTRAFGTWETAAAWARDDARNIITSAGVETRTCQSPGDPMMPATRNQVQFRSDASVEFHCDSVTAYGCWVYSGDATTPQSPQFLFVKASSHGNTPQGCDFLDMVLAHEMGHAWGLGHSDVYLSIVHDLDAPLPCRPTHFDAVAIMGLYQSR